MELFRSWIYGREKRTVFPPSSDEGNSKIPLAVSRSVDDNMSAFNTPKLGNNALRREEERSKIEQWILKVVPLQPGDCLGCKLVGTSVFVTSGVIVLTSAIAGRKRNTSLKGKKLTTYYALCGSLFVGFQAAAVCRFFDIGPFGYLARLQAKDYSNR